MRKAIVTIFIVATISLVFPQWLPEAQASDRSYQVQAGDTLWKISKKFDVPVAAIKKVNGKHSNDISVGERLAIPDSLTADEKELLARLVHAEAKGESYAGKVAVATVVLNRVDHPSFPNNVADVIYEVSPGGYYAFSPVQNGEINKPAGADSVRAVEEALQFRGQGQGSIYFYNPKTATSQWIRTKEVTIVIGNHTFAK